MGDGAVLAILRRQIAEGCDGLSVYTFTEKAGSNARWTYDDSVYTMTVNVIRNAEDKLEAQKTITKNGAEVSIVEFKNSYLQGASGRTRRTRRHLLLQRQQAHHDLRRWRRAFAQSRNRRPRPLARPAVP